MPEGTTEASKRDQAEVSAFRESFASMFVAAGVPRMPARVFGALITNDSGDMTAAELAENLQASPAAISGAVRYLLQVGMISRERKPGSRRDVFRLFDDMWDTMLRRRNEMLRVWSVKMHEGTKAVGEDTPAGRRLLESAEYFEFMAQTLPAALDQWQAYRASRHPQ